MVEAHPGKEGNALSLGDATAAQWVEAIDDARALIRAGLPALAGEHRELLAEVVPVGGPMEVSLSASYKEAIGVVYISLHRSPLKMAEALVHELQHNKLNLVAWSDPILLDATTLHASPVRPDPRPLWGVLLAAHAFLLVVELYRSLERLGHPLASTATFRERLDEVLTANREAMDVVREHARPTELGRTIIGGMDRLERRQRS
jgi:HEXXH motif-containing protein